MVIDYKQILRQLILADSIPVKKQKMITKLRQWDDQNFKKQCEEVWNI